MNIHFEVRIHVGVSEFGPGKNDYYATSRSKKFDDEKQAREFLVDLEMHHSNMLLDFLQEHFGYEEFDICNFRVLGLFKITEEELKWTT